uniref:Uncharacterized protein TCIL3000_9_4500 n=1 Tax=Trypanosoma congolense (strain IL3000) TaxID=1068625 RepID=G0UUI6_TRYCI|nr:unnamed protein product [Trypanosoma congolense IL3000]
MMDPEQLMVTVFIWVGCIGVLFTICLAFAAYHMRDRQNNLLYFPNVPPDSTCVCDSPAEMGFTNSEQVHIRTADGVTLRGFIMWHCPESHSARLMMQSRTECGQRYTLRTVTGEANPSDAISSVPADDAAAVTGDGSWLQYVILYFHGNAGNVGHRIPIAALLTSKYRCAVLMVDYRGFGLSDAVPPTEEGLKLDAQACLDYLIYHPRLPFGRIFVMGTSLGGAVAIHLAAQSHNAGRIAGVIVENTFTSISDMSYAVVKGTMQKLNPCCLLLWNFLFNYYVKPLCLYIKWRSIDDVQKIQAPMLFLSGLKDEVIPPKQMKKLYANALEASDRKFVEFHDGGHCTLPLMSGYNEVIHAFVQSTIRRRDELV